MLSGLDLKVEYHGEEDDIQQDFFAPCFSNCVRYDRCAETLSVDSLLAITTRFDNFLSGQVKMRFIAGHRIGVRDMDILEKIFSGTEGGSNQLSRHIASASSMVQRGQIMVRVAVPMLAQADGGFLRRMGSFEDENGDMVVFTGSAGQSFCEKQNDFESVDVYTSWNDTERVTAKTRHFQKLWDDDMGNIRTYDFAHAMKSNLLKYSAEWAIRD